MKFLDYMKKYCNDDTTKVEKIIESKEIKMKKILESAFDDQYVSKEVALHRIQTEFIDDRIAPKSIDKTFLKENMKEVLSKVQKLTEGEIKIIINNDIDKSGVGRSMPTIDVVDSDDMPMEGKKRGRGRPPKSKVATLEQPKDEVDEDNAVQTPVVTKKIDKLAEKDTVVEEPVVTKKIDKLAETDAEESDPNEVEPNNDEDDTEVVTAPKKSYAEYVDKFKKENADDDSGEEGDVEGDVEGEKEDDDEDDDETTEEGSKKLTWDEVAKYLDKEPMKEKEGEEEDDDEGGEEGGEDDEDDDEDVDEKTDD
jgi:hypothetical protein